MSYRIVSSKPSPALFEPLEERRLLSASLRPDHIVVVIEQDRSADAVGNPIWDYLNNVAQSALVYTNYHGVTHPTQSNILALYSGSTQGITTNSSGNNFPTQDNLAKSLFDGGFSFGGYVENLPADGSQANFAGNANYPDLYSRYSNPMAMFSNIGIDSSTGQPRPNSAVNRTFNAFSSIPTSNYSSLPAVSYVIPNALNSTHGSNNAEPWAGSPDEQSNNILRDRADNWLAANIDSYLQWAKNNNSLLIIVGDEERWVGGNSATATMLVAGDPDLYVAGVNNTAYNHFNLVRSITDAYGLSPLGDTLDTPALSTDAQGRLAPTVTTGAVLTLTAAPSPSTVGQDVRFTATLASAAPGGSIPTGTVQFKVDGNNFGAPVPILSGVATSPAINSLTAGNHTITALYNGDSTYTPVSSSNLTHRVLLSNNNNFAGRATLTGSSATATTLNTSATKEAGEPNHAGNKGGKSVWWTWTAPVGGYVTINTAGSTFDTLLAVYTGTAVNALAAVASNDDAPGGGTLTSRVGFNAVAGRVYQIAVDGYNGLAGDITLNLNLANQPPQQAPANDNLANATVIAPNGQTVTGTNLAATRETGEQWHVGVQGSRSVWWSWIAPRNAVVTLSTLGSTFDTLLAVYTGNTPPTLLQIAANDDSPAGNTTTSRLTFNAISGTTYRIAVDGWAGATGNITLALSLA